MLIVRNFGFLSFDGKRYIERPWVSPGKGTFGSIRLKAVGEALITTIEKRGAMSDRKSLVSAFWLSSALAFLVPVLVAPGRTLGFAPVSPRAESLRPDFVIFPGQSTTGIDAVPAIDEVLQVSALASENEEQDRVDALDEPRVSFLLPCSLPKAPDRQSIAPRPILSLYPLRC